MNESAARDWGGAGNVLCVRLDGMGDVLMTGPALRALKESCPGRRITLLTSRGGARAARLLPEVDAVVAYAAPWMKGATEGAACDLALLDALRKMRPDGAVIFTVYSQSPLPAALFCYLADIPLRLARCRENPYHLLTHHVPETEPEAGVRHEVERQLDLVAAIGCRTADDRLRVALSEAQRAGARRRLREAGIDLERPWLAVHPGATAPSRRYSPGSYAAALARLVREEGLQVLLTGSAGEAPLLAEVERLAGTPLPRLAEDFDLGVLAAIVELAPALLTNNTGPAHLAAATGTPVVDLYALTNPQHAPWRVPSRVLSRDVPCRWCYRSVCPEGHHNCLALVSPDEVVEAVLGLLEETSARLDTG